MKALVFDACCVLDVEEVAVAIAVLALLLAATLRWLFSLGRSGR